MGNVYRPNADYSLATQVVGDNGKVAFIQKVEATDSSGTSLANYSVDLIASGSSLAAGATSTAVTGIPEGSYGWALQMTGTTPSLILEYLGPDGATYITLETATTSGSSYAGTIGVVIGANATVRLRNPTGATITAISSSLS
jgi:hypothetical protein